MPSSQLPPYFCKDLNLQCLCRKWELHPSQNRYSDLITETHFSQRQGCTSLPMTVSKAIVASRPMMQSFLQNSMQTENVFHGHMASNFIQKVKSIIFTIKGCFIFSKRWIYLATEAFEIILIYKTSKTILVLLTKTQCYI